MLGRAEHSILGVLALGAVTVTRSRLSLGLLRRHPAEVARRLVLTHALPFVLLNVISN